METVTFWCEKRTNGDSRHVTQRKGGWSALLPWQQPIGPSRLQQFKYRKNHSLWSSGCALTKACSSWIIVVHDVPVNTFRTGSNTVTIVGAFLTIDRAPYSGSKEGVWLRRYSPTDEVFSPRPTSCFDVSSDSMFSIAVPSLTTTNLVWFSQEVGLGALGADGTDDIILATVSAVTGDMLTKRWHNVLQQSCSVNSEDASCTTPN